MGARRRLRCGAARGVRRPRLALYADGGRPRPSETPPVVAYSALRPEGRALRCGHFPTPADTLGAGRVELHSISAAGV
jgi:hypothetical protein